MSSLFKTKRSSNSDSKSSSSSSKIGPESDSKAPKNSGSKSGSAAAATPSASAPSAAAAAAAAASPPLPPNAKQSSTSSKQGRVGRSKSFDANTLAEMDSSLPIGNRLMGSTASDKTLSISRSGRFKATGRARARLFSDGSPDGSADHPDGDRRGATTLSSPEDRQTVLDAMAMKSGRSPTPAGEVTSPKWSVAPNSLDL